MDKDIDKGNMLMYSFDKNGIKYKPYSLDELNNPEKYGIDKFDIKRLKNTLVKEMIDGIELISNSTSSQFPIEFESIKKIGNSYAANSIAKDYDKNNPYHIFVHNAANMVGKDVIGIMATGIKMWSALFQSQIEAIKNKELYKLNKPLTLIEDGKDVVYKLQNLPLFNLDLTGFDENSMKRLSDVLGGLEQDLLELQQATNNGNTALIQQIKDRMFFKKYSVEPKVDLVLSALLSLATDRN